MNASFEKASAHLNDLKRRGGPLIEAHRHCANHRSEIEASEMAGCFYCCSTFAANTVVDWLDDDGTAMCPNCSIDSVIGDSSGFPVADTEFLKQMHQVWF